MYTGPPTGSSIEVISASARSANVTISSARSRNSSPSGVSVIVRLPRSNSVQPSLDSNSRN